MVDPVRQAGYTFATIDDLAEADCSAIERARLLVDSAVAASFPLQRLVTFDLLEQLEPLGDVGPVVRETQEVALDGLIDDMWRHEQPETVEVLEALGRHLADEQQAKAARRAVIKHRSWLANR